MDIVYVSDHNYMFCSCVSIYSLMEQTPKEREVRLHLLTDDSFCEEDRRLLQLLTDHFVNLKLNVVKLDDKVTKQWELKDPHWSKAVFYRLCISEILRDIDVCLYIDSDTLVVSDITAVFDTDMEGMYIAGVFADVSSVREQVTKDETEAINRYVNSGVLLMNLSLMRKDGMQRKFMECGPDFIGVDEHILNKCCNGHIKLLPQGYNCMPGISEDKPRIIHFLLQDYLRPWKNRRAKGSKEWWECASFFSDIVDMNSLYASADWYDRGSIIAIFRKCADFKKIYIVGNNSDAERIHNSLRLGRCRGLQPLAGDNNEIPYDNESFIVFASRKRNAKALENYKGLKTFRQQVHFYEKRPVSYYNLLPGDLKKEVYGELLMKEFGADTRGVYSIPTLLEINAARFPQKAAVIEYRDGERSILSFEQLNRQANRIADSLIKSKVKRGSKAAVSKQNNKISNNSRIASAMGAVKGGYVFCFNSGNEPYSEDVAIINTDVLEAAGFSFRSPYTVSLPDEPAVLYGANLFTGRMLMEEAEDLRKRLGIHAGDILIASGLNEYAGFCLFLASLPAGNSTVAFMDPNGEELIEAINREKCTIAFFNASDFEKIVVLLESDASKERRNALGSLRCIMGDKIPSELSARWSSIMPGVPYGGLGYAGDFRYDSEWYI